MTPSVSATSHDARPDSSHLPRNTELGELPWNWDIAPLFKNWDVLDCKHVTAKFVFSGWPVASIRELQSRFVDLSEAKQTTDAFYRLLVDGGRRPQPGDLIVSRNATVGEVAQVAAWHPPFAMGQDVCLLRKRSQEHSTDYLQSLFHSRTIVRQLENLMTGSTFRRVNVKQVKGLFIPIPPPEEQRAIAAALSDVDELIGALDRLIAKKRAIKLATMQQLLTGRKRLPGFTGEWREWRLIDLFAGKKEYFDDGDWIESEYITSTGIRLIQTGNIGEGCFLDKENKKYISEDSCQLLRCKEVQVGDLLICRLAEPAGRACIVPDIGEARMITAVDVTICRPVEADADYLVQLFSTSWWFEQVDLRCGGTTRSRIARGQLARIEVHLPPMKEQNAIAAVLRDMDGEIAALEQRRDKTIAIKQGMMQQLLTGRIRLVPMETDT